MVRGSGHPTDPAVEISHPGVFPDGRRCGTADARRESLRPLVDAADRVAPPVRRPGPPVPLGSRVSGQGVLCT